jgi:hypothetical protein
MKNALHLSISAFMCHHVQFFIAMEGYQSTETACLFGLLLYGIITSLGSWFIGQQLGCKS